MNYLYRESLPAQSFHSLVFMSLLFLLKLKYRAHYKYIINPLHNAPVLLKNLILGTSV